MKFKTIGKYFLRVGLLICLGVHVFAASDWTSVRSKNFNLAGEATEAELGAVAERLEQFRDVFSQIFPQFGVNSKAKANVIIFRDAESFRPFKPKRPDGTADESIAGYFLAGENVNYITLAMKGGKTDPFHTIFHEYIHFLLRSRTGSKDLPPWLAEGLAQYFETLQVTPENKVVIGSAPQNRLAALRRGELLPDSELLSAARTAVHSGSGVRRSMFYAQAWLLVHYLLHQGESKPYERLERFLQLIGENNSSENALKQVYGIETGQLSGALSSYLQLPALPVSVEPVSVKLEASAENPGMGVSPAIANAYLGDLLHQMGRLSEAETYLRAAVAADRKLGLANASLGQLLIRREKWEEAARFLEAAIGGSSADYFVHFNYAYALSRASAPGGMVHRFAPGVFTRMSESLKRAIALEPEFAQSYRILAFIYLVNGEKLTEAAALLQKGLSLAADDETFEVLLTKVLVRLDRYEEARGYAEKLSQKARDPELRADAAEILTSITQYLKTRLQIAVAPTSRSLPWSPSLVLLKRSWVSETDLETIERGREISNLNRVLERPRAGERRILGTIQKVDCVGGSIIYNVHSGGENLSLFGERFDDLRMAVLVSGQHSFRLDCGVRLPSDPAVLAFSMPVDKRPNSRPQLTSITFVPDYFRLMSPEELAASRQVVIENDLLKRVTGTSDIIERGSVDTSGRWASIRAELRPLRTGETRAPGTLESIDCSGNGFSAIGVIDGKRHRFDAEPSLLPRWFGVESTQVSLSCGSQPRIADVLFTYRPAEAEGPRAYNLLALEFLPSGFPVTSVTGPVR